MRNVKLHSNKEPESYDDIENKKCNTTYIFEKISNTVLFRDKTMVDNYIYH